MTLAKDIKAVMFDSGGVIFSEQVLFDPERGEVLRMRSHADGQGISLLRDAGLRIAFITSDSNGFLETLGNKLNNLPSVKSGKWEPIAVFTGDKGKDKVATIKTWLAEHDFGLGECAYMGDDIGDYHIMQKVGFRAAPAQAESLIKDMSDFIAERRGGDGAVRDFCSFLLTEKGIDASTLSQK